MSEKCFCHFNGMAVKDATARKEIEEVKKELDSTRIEKEYLVASNEKVKTLISPSSILFYDKNTNESKSILSYLAGHTNIGNTNTNTTIKSKNKPTWDNGSETKQLATNEEVDNAIGTFEATVLDPALDEINYKIDNLPSGGSGGSYPTNPEFDLATIDNLHVGDDIWINDEHGFSMGGTQLTGSFLLIEGNGTLNTMVTQTGVSTPTINIKSSLSPLLKHSIPTGIGQYETKRIIDFEDGETYLFGDSSFNTIIDSATKPRWRDGSGEYKELATMDDIQSGGGSLPSNPTFEGATFTLDNLNFITIIPEYVNIYDENDNDSYYKNKEIEWISSNGKSVVIRFNNSKLEFITDDRPIWKNGDEVKELATLDDISTKIPFNSNNFDKTYFDTSGNEENYLEDFIATADNCFNVEIIEDEINLTLKNNKDIIVSEADDNFHNLNPFQSYNFYMGDNSIIFDSSELLCLRTTKIYFNTLENTGSGVSIIINHPDLQGNKISWWGYMSGMVGFEMTDASVNDILIYYDKFKNTIYFEKAIVGEI